MFRIIEFTSSKTIAVIPSNWMTLPGICLWPPKKSTQVDKLVKKKAGPEENWDQFAVRTLGSFGTYDEARSYLKKAEATSDLQSEAETSARASRKRLPKRFSSDEESNDESQSLLSPAPLLPKQIKLGAYVKQHLKHTPEILSPAPSTPTAPASPNISFQTENQTLLTPHTLNTAPLRKQPLFAPHTHYTSPLQKQTLFASHTHHTTPLQTQTELSTHYLEQPMTSHNENTQNCSCSKIQLQILQSLKNEVASHTTVLKAHTEMLEKHTRVLARFLQHHKVSVTDPAQITSSPENNCPIPLPASNIEELEMFENYLQRKENFSQMVTYFASFGGQGTKRILQRLMQNLLKQELSLQLNWMGRRGKQAFMKYSCIHGLIYRAAKCNIQDNLTLDDVEKFIKDFLRFAPDRCGGRKLRQSSNADV